MTGRPRNPERVKRDCHHKKANHQHGTVLAYVNDRCRCTPCTDANSAYVVNRRKQIAYGRWGAHFTDAQPVREHIQLLRAAGMGIRTIATRSGASTGSIDGILYGDKGSPPAVRVTVTTARKILAVRPALDSLADGAMIDATGTRRRLQALVALGWTQNRLSRELNCTHQHVAHLLNYQGKTTAANAKRIRNLYERIWDQPPNPANRYEAGGISRAKRAAIVHGWAPPMAWDDDTIDDPNATPDGGQQEGRSDKQVHVDDLEHLLLFDPLATAQHLADRLHVTRDAIQNACRRNDRHDLLDQLNRNADLLRPGQANKRGTEAA